MENSNQNSGFSIASLVLGIISIILFCIPYISIPGSILAIIFGCIGKNKGGKGMAIAGLVLGIIALALYILTVIGVLGFLNFTANSVNSIS